MAPFLSDPLRHSPILDVGYPHLVLLLSVLVFGCTTTRTQGPIDRSMDSLQPYIYSCDCSKSAAIDEVKNYLASTGWTVESENVDAGVIASSKSLGPSEKLKISTGAKSGTRTTEQVGRLTFSLRTAGDTTGTGIILLKTNEGIMIANVAQGSPADSIGVQAGEYLRAINGRNTSDVTIQQATSFLSTTPGARDTLRLAATPDGEARSVVVPVGDVPKYSFARMQGQIRVTVNQGGQQSQQSSYVIRGHPMMISHGRSLHRKTDLTLKSPGPTTLPNAGSK